MRGQVKVTVAANEDSKTNQETLFRFSHNVYKWASTVKLLNILF